MTILSQQNLGENGNLTCTASQASQINGYSVCIITWRGLLTLYYWFDQLEYLKIWKKAFLNPIRTLSTGMISVINFIPCEHLSIDVVSMGFHRQASRNDYAAKGPVLFRVTWCVLMQARAGWWDPKKWSYWIFNVVSRALFTLLQVLAHRRSLRFLC